MIRLGDFVLERVSAKGGDEGWTEHWEVKRYRGRVLGHAVNLQGAIRIAVTQGGLDAEAGNRAYTSVEQLVADLRARLGIGLPDPASGGDSGQERGSAPRSASDAALTELRALREAATPAELPGPGPWQAGREHAFTSIRIQIDARIAELERGSA